jgi:hypothetical protein
MTMRRLIAGLLLVIAAEGTALACSCLAPGTPEKSRAYAREAVQRALAIVEADVLSEYRAGGPGERIRVRKLLWGKAPAEFRIARGAFASGASCDLLLREGESKVLILYDPAEAIDRPGTGEPEAGTLSIQSLCSDFLVSQPGHLAVTLEEARRRGRPVIGERG